ncbi:hypothetical protein [Streptomyces guryensis]|uniref:Uncharacterized protein n=1 Tax=Streptomyces guryensis TaxID=2886947 RepID=A0A9Q3Z3G8_9ACTN|nr:hypothetical protein [Streptomyces guryensis]MCD9872531.1 hypothetical protein [Streptomyces guryensis]
MVVDNGAWQRYYSHWAAHRVVDDLLPGPVAATRCFRANREIDEWLDDVWCEGAALVDHDRRILLSTPSPAPSPACACLTEAFAPGAATGNPSSTSPPAPACST